MEKPKPTQNHEQERPKTLEDYVVATFHADADPDITTSPLTVIRSGQDGKGVRYDGGWIPGDILSVCDTDSEEGISPIELFVKVHKPVKVNGEYVIATKIVSLKKLQSREANKGFNESYIQDLYGKSTEEMATEGADAAGQVWRQKHPASDWNELLDVKASPETPSDDLDTEGNSEKSLKDEVSPAMGSLAVKTVEVSPVKTNETGVSSPALVMTKEVMESIGAIKVNDSVDLPAVRAIGVKKPTVKAAEIKKPVETGLDESDSPELNRFDERVRELMKPLETDVDGMPFENESVRVNYYDYLYDPNYVPSNNVEDAAVRNPKGVPVSENSFNAAKEAIYDLATNPSLMQIINPERALDPEVIINGVRSSHLTRCRLFEYLTSSLDRLAVVNPGALADRVLRDSYDNLKSPNYLGGNYYAGKMRSREYTVVLAIAMMDGSFDVDRQDKMVTHYRGGRERSGMHRDSARALLEYVRNNY